MNNTYNVEINNTSTIDFNNPYIIETLQYAFSSGMIHMEDVQDDMRKAERQRLLNMHTNSIFYSENEKRWKTTLPDETKKNNRRLIARKNKTDLEDLIIEFYKEKEEKEKAEQEGRYNEYMTLRDVFPDWLNYKNCQTQASSYIRRIKNDWNRYYEHDSIVDIPIKNLTYIQLNTWAHNLVKNNSLTSKQYYNMSMIIRQALDYVAEEYPAVITDNTFKRVKIKSRMFRKTKKPASETQVFTDADKQAICDLALEKYKKRPKSISGLAIVFNFHLGLRVGELVALKWSDIDYDRNRIHIQRMESAQYSLDKEGEVTKTGVGVVEYTKSDAGDRELYLDDTARSILDMVRKRSMKYNFYDDDYIFVNLYSKRLKGGKINEFLYDLCDEINIGRKSTHKIRKTYISTLFDGGLNIDKIREIAGHEDEKTSLHNYCFDRREDKETEKLLESLNTPVSICQI
ncbi:MAG: site-specific integrase [Clostridiales bacterium]|nr:site-specific integrase [Clostridiales bacterium]